jgi:hypothetical protein
VTLDIEITQKVDHLQVDVSGTYDMREAIDRFPLVIAACRLTGLDKALIDFRQLEGETAAIQKLIYAIEVTEYYQKHLDSGGQPLRIAYLGQAPLVSTYEPGLDLARQEQLPFTLTTDLDEALSWLGVEDT